MHSTFCFSHSSLLLRLTTLRQLSVLFWVIVRGWLMALYTDKPSIMKRYPYKAILEERDSNLQSIIYCFIVFPILDFSKFIDLLATHFQGKEIESEHSFQNEGGDNLSISYREEFGGMAIELSTNSLILIEAIDVICPEPIPPWHTFPNAAPIETIMNKQGSMDHWWSYVWIPFWTSLSHSEQERYLLRHGASEDWQDALLTDITY